LDDVDEVLRESFHFDRDPADLPGKMVVSDDRRDGGSDSGCGRDQRFGNSGCDDREVRGARRADVLKRVHDPPDRSEEPDEGSGARGSGEPADMLFEKRDFGAGASDQGSLDVFDAMDVGEGLFVGRDFFELFDAGLEDVGDRRASELIALAQDLVDTFAVPEEIEKLDVLLVGSGDGFPLGEDDGPAIHRCAEQDEKHELGHETGVGDEAEHTRLGQLGTGHINGSPSTDLSYSGAGRGGRVF